MNKEQQVSVPALVVWSWGCPYVKPGPVSLTLTLNPSSAFASDLARHKDWEEGARCPWMMPLALHKYSLHHPAVTWRWGLGYRANSPGRSHSSIPSTHLGAPGSMACSLSHVTHPALLREPSCPRDSRHHDRQPGQQLGDSRQDPASSVPEVLAIPL